MAHDSHPAFGNLTFLVFSAVLQVVCVSLPGYIVARLGHFDAEKQKFLANLNVMLFTPCLSKSELLCCVSMLVGCHAYRVGSPERTADSSNLPLQFSPSLPPN